MNNALARLARPTAIAAAALGFAAVLAGCVSSAGIAPKTQPLDLQTLVPVAAHPVDVSDRWWQAYGDPALDALVVRGLADNPDLAAVRARVERAAAQVDASDAQRKPRVDGGAEVTRERFTDHGLVPPPYAGTSRSDGDLALTGSWEIDVFGRERALLDAAIGSQRAADADLQAARVLLASRIVREYVLLAQRVDRRAVLERTLAQRQQILDLVRERVAAGLDTTVELRQGEGAVPEIRVALDEADEQIEISRHALAALTSQGPDALHGLAPRLGQVEAVPLPDDIPADLLGRRADVVAARWRVEAATHDLKAARAAFYPSVNLTAFAGFSAIGLSQLLEAGSRQIGIAPAVSLPIFDAGRLRAQYRGKATDVDSAVDAYDTAVLEALRETADALSTVRHVEVQRQQQAQALDRAERAYDLAQQRYGAGLGTYLTVLSAETNVLAQRQNDNDLKAKALDAQAQLARALGGGYVAPDARPPAVHVATRSPSNQELTP